MTAGPNPSEDGAVPSPAAQNTDDPIASPVPSKATILLVDDQQENLVALDAILLNLGQTLVEAHSGEEALRFLLDHDVTLILLDVKMPTMDGFETATLIRTRARLKHIPIIFVTGIQTLEEDVQRGYALGAVDYLVKPFPAETLRSKVAGFYRASSKVRGDSAPGGTSASNGDRTGGRPRAGKAACRSETLRPDT